MDATYGAYVAAKNNTLNKSNNSNNGAKNKNTHVKYRNSMYGQHFFTRACTIHAWGPRGPWGGFSK